MLTRKSDAGRRLFIPAFMLGIYLSSLFFPGLSGAGEKNITDKEIGSITREQVVKLVVKENKELAALAWQVQADRAAISQAGLVANPELDVEFENFAGSGGVSNFDAAETTVAVSQLVQLGGKRQKRKRLAGLAADASALAYEAGKLDIVAAACQSFIRLLTGQQRFELAEEQVQLAEKVLEAVRDRVEAGKVSPIEVTKARVNLSTRHIALDKVRRQLTVNRQDLASFWTISPSFTRAEGSLALSGQVLPDLETLSERVQHHPHIKKLAIKLAGQQAELALARAERIPDITISGGVRQFEETNDTAFIAGISIPLMFFDRNQGGISEAGHNVSMGKAALAAAKVTLLNKLQGAYSAYKASDAEVQALAADVLPGALAAFEATQEGYRQGKFAYLDVLDAQQTLFEVTSNHIDALSARQEAVVEVRRLAGIGEEYGK